MPALPRVTVVVCTLDRVAALRDTIGALRRQTFADFEVVAVDGPSRDGTGSYLASLGGDVRTLSNPERHLSKSRNLGLAAAAGDVVAFIDDDAVPEPRWLEELVAPFAGDPRLGATGGLVLDHTGVRAQWRHLVCARTGDQDFDRLPPLERFCGPGADPFLYVPGGNSAFRREALVQVGGFDEEIEYNFDETEVCLQLHDHGWGLRSLDGARVHHRALPSHLRTDAAFLDPFFEVKNRVYFGLRHGRATRLQAEVLAALARHLGHLRGSARDAQRRGRMTVEQLERYLGRADAGFHAGLQRGLYGARRSIVVPPADPAAFLAYPRLAPSPRRRIAVVGGRADAEAAAGHEVHAITLIGAGEPYSVAYADGTWTWRVPVNARWLPDVEDATERARLERRAALHGALGMIGEAELRDPGALLEGPAPAVLVDPVRFPVDWEAEARVCLDERGDEAFVDCAFRRLLGREPDPLGRRLALVELDSGGERQALVARIAQSVEGRGRGIDPGLAEKLPPVSLRAAAARLRTAWLLDDAAFARAVTELLVGRPEAVDVGDRVAAVRALARRVEARQRVAGAHHLPPDDVRRRPQLRAALDAAARRRSDADFLTAIYRVLLGRELDPVGREHFLRVLAGSASRAWVARDLAAAPEAVRHGTSVEIVCALVDRSPVYRLDQLVRRARRSGIGTVRRLRPSTRG